MLHAGLRLQTNLDTCEAGRQSGLSGYVSCEHAAKLAARCRCFTDTEWLSHGGHVWQSELEWHSYTLRRSSVIPVNGNLRESVS